jgi:hypothetical protein
MQSSKVVHVHGDLGHARQRRSARPLTRSEDRVGDDDIAETVLHEHLRLRDLRDGDSARASIDLHSSDFRDLVCLDVRP